MATVYITSNRMRKDPFTKELKPIVDLRPAAQFGELRAVFDHEMDPQSTADMQEAAFRLSEFDQSSDYILPNGSPLATLATGLVLKDSLNLFEPLRVLMWDRMQLRYTVEEISLEP